MKKIFKITIWDNSRIYDNKKSYPNCCKKYHIYAESESEACKKVMDFANCKSRQNHKNFAYGEITYKIVEI